jgi:hypothetical protein
MGSADGLLQVLPFCRGGLSAHQKLRIVPYRGTDETHDDEEEDAHKMKCTHVIGFVGGENKTQKWIKNQKQASLGTPYRYYSPPPARQTAEF